MNLNALEAAPRLLLEAKLEPVQGTRFQSTGFPEIGAAQYDDPDGTRMLLVESVQSVANRLEAVCWDESEDDWVPELRGLPLVKVRKADGTPLTNSILEAHRINSEYIARAPEFEKIKEKINHVKGERFSLVKQLAPALLKYDINSLIHGVFLEEVAGVIQLPRAISSFIEARGVTTAPSGGVKFGLDPKQKGGEGNVTYPREEFVSGSIRAYFNLDLAQIRGYGFSKQVNNLLIELALFKVLKFLEVGLRLRTACDLNCVAVDVQKPADFDLPSLEELRSALPELIADAGVEFETITIKQKK